MESVYIPAAALVLVSDGRRARFLRNKGTPKQPQLIVEQVIEQENPATREADWQPQQEERFAAEIADELYRLEHAHKFRELVMVAPPKMLGDLRARLHPEVANCVVAEVARDLTGHPVPELGKLLS
jgi:protein required for attachment to host cells